MATSKSEKAQSPVALRRNFSARVRDFKLKLKDFRVDHALQNIWQKLSDLDKHINENEPWAIKDAVKLKEVLNYEINELRNIGKIIEPFIPQAAKRVQEQLGTVKIKTDSLLFPRLQ